MATRQFTAFRQFEPSEAAAIIFTVVFGLLLGAHLWQSWRAKIWYLWPLIIATALEFVGYILREYCIKNRHEKIPYIISQVFVIISPACLAADLYMLVGRAMLYVGPGYSIIRPNWITPLFVGLDFLSIATQGLGGGILFGDITDINKLKRGRMILILGLFIQLVAFAIFLFFAVWFDVKTNRDLKQKVAKLRPLMNTFYVSGGLILLRSIYRAIEFISVDFTTRPARGYFFNVEWAYYVLDALPIANIPEMPREDSIGSSGGSITSDEEEPIQNTTVHPTSSVVVTRPPGSDAASATVAGGTVRGPGIKRFQKTVRKVIQMNKIQSAFNPGGIGAEPGIDPRRPGSDAAYGHIKEPCEIEVIDYSATNYEIQQLDNTQFKAMMRATGGKRPPWAKVRWINVAGISWDVLSTLGITYNLHPLTLENILGGMKTARSKADYYTNHLFLHIMCQSLAEKESAASPLANVNPRRSSEHHAFRSKSPQQMTPEEEDAADEKNLRRRKRSQDVDVEKGISKSKGKGKTKDPKKKYRSPTEERRLETEERIKHTEEGNEKLRNNEYSVKVVTKGLFLYLLRDGTVISVHQADRGFGDPIYRRLQTPNTILRASADPSLLIEALLDLVVDRALDIVDRFHENILACERSILLKPKMNTVRQRMCTRLYATRLVS
ncbi:hypothetical protein FRC19_001187 [Serendipita sp. 401]|nr:hypothetical protein FRC19_001187 [Serendipita sp. 401]